MRSVLVLCPYVPHPAMHGGSQRSRVLLQALGEDHDVQLAAAVATDEQRANLAALARELGLRSHELPAIAPPRSQGSRLSNKLGCWLRGDSELLARRWQPQATAAVAALVAAQAFDLVVLDSSFVLPVWRSTAPRTLLHLHNLEHAVLARSGAGASSLSARLTRRIEAGRIEAREREAIGRAQLVVTVSEPDRQLALRLQAQANVAVVPNSVDVERLSLLPPATAGELRLLFVGSFDYPPNVEAVTELIEQHLPVLRRAFPALVVRVVGRDPAAVLARFRGLVGVEVVGPVEDLRPHYQASHAVYLPIRSGGGTRIKILEAWAYGRPVLSTRVGAEGLDGVEGQHWLGFETPAAGAIALQRVVAGGTGSMVAQARALVEQRYSHQSAVTALRGLVASMLG